MYKIKAIPPYFGLYSETGEFILSVNCLDNAELIKKILNYDSVFIKPYFNFKSHSNNSKIDFEKLVDNKIL